MKCRWLLIGAFLGTTLACSLIERTPAPAETAWQATVDALVALRSGLGLPEHLRSDSPVRHPDDFDTNAYFSVLKHLSMAPGYVLDYVYYMDGMGGHPVLYARPAEQAPYAAYDDYAAAVGGRPDPHAYLAHVQADGTAESYLELALLRTMAGQFYLYWHAGYNDTTLVCSWEAAEALIADNAFGMSMPKRDRAAVRRLDFEPQVELRDEAAVVRVVTFTKWGGFFEDTFSFRRDSPHTLLDLESDELVPYDCGVML